MKKFTIFCVVIQVGLFEDGLDIPVFFRTDMANQIPPIDINFSNKTIAILLVDDNMYCNTIWDEYIKKNY